MTTPIPGHGLDTEEEQLLQETAEQWRQVWNETPVQAIARIEDAAKQLIAVTSALQVLYAAIFGFSRRPDDEGCGILEKPNGFLRHDFFLIP